MRTFVLQRNQDETGISGTGIVAEGIQFTDGRVAMRWTTPTATTTVYDRIEDVEALHGHGGKTVIVWAMGWHNEPINEYNMISGLDPAVNLTEHNAFPHLPFTKSGIDYIDSFKKDSEGIDSSHKDAQTLLDREEPDVLTPKSFAWQTHGPESIQSLEELEDALKSLKKKGAPLPPKGFA